MSLEHGARLPHCPAAANTRWCTRPAQAVLCAGRAHAAGRHDCTPGRTCLLQQWRLAVASLPLPSLQPRRRVAMPATRAARPAPPRTVPNTPWRSQACTEICRRLRVRDVRMLHGGCWVTLRDAAHPLSCGLACGRAALARRHTAHGACSIATQRPLQHDRTWNLVC